MFDIVTEIGADLTPLQNGLNLGIGLIAEFGREAASLVNKIAENIGNSFETLFKEGKFATGLNIQIDKFNELKYAADQSGVGVQGLERVYSRLNKTIGDALNGKKDEQALLSALGLDPATIGKSQDKIRDFAKSLESITNVSQRASLLSAIVGTRGGQTGELLEFLHLLGGGVDDVGKRYKQLTADIGDLGLAKVFLLKEAWKDFQLSTQNVYDLLAVKFATPLTNILLQILDIKDSGNEVKTIIDSIFVKLENGLAGFARVGVAVFDMVRGEIQQVGAAITSWGDVFAAMKRGDPVGLLNAAMNVKRDFTISFDANSPKALAAEKWVRDLFHGRAEAMAEERAAQMKARRLVDDISPISMTKPKPLGFATTLEGIVGLPGNIGKSLNAGTREVQLVADHKAHGFLEKIAQFAGAPPRVY